MSVENARRTGLERDSRRFPAEPLPCPTLDASATPDAPTWLPVCRPEPSWQDRLISESSRIIEAHAPDEAWKRRHIALVLDGRIHRDSAQALGYVARLALARMSFVCRSGLKTFAAPYKGATRQ